VIAGNEDFFALTKRIHNFLHGSSGDGGDLDAFGHLVKDAARVVPYVRGFRDLGRSGNQLARRVFPGCAALPGLTRCADTLPGRDPARFFNRHRGASRFEASTLCEVGRPLRISRIHGRLS
jgi:hypothetical protein